MDWRSSLEERLEGAGFQTDWVWMNRSVLFLLAWKGHRVQVNYVEWEGGYRPLKVVLIKNVFIDLLGYLRRYERFENAFKGRNVTYRWMAFRDLCALELEILEEAGVTPVRVSVEGDFPLE